MKVSKVSPYRIERYNGLVLHSVLHFDDLNTAKLALIPIRNNNSKKLSMYLIDKTQEILEYISSTKESKQAVDKNIKREKENKK